MRLAPDRELAGFPVLDGGGELGEERGGVVRGRELLDGDVGVSVRGSGRWVDRFDDAGESGGGEWGGRVERGGRIEGREPDGVRRRCQAEEVSFWGGLINVDSRMVEIWRLRK